MKAVAYARYSSDSQREESITAQLRAIRNYCAKKEIALLAEYMDEAQSGTTDDRPEFQQMIRDLKDGKDGLKIDLVLVHKLDRFARNRYDSAVYRREIGRSGARVIAVDQPVDSSPEGMLTEALLEALAEYYSANLARETLKGLKENAHQARFNGGHVPFGYCIVDGCYEINESEAPAIQLIFSMFVAGASYGEISSALNAQGLKTRFGNPWSGHTLHELLKNPKYAGLYIYNRAPRKIGGKRNWRRSKPEEDLVVVPGGVPAIVDPEVWQEAQKLLSRRRKWAKPMPEVPYLLSGKVRCAVCGCKVAGGTHRTRGKPYRYYVCQGRQRAGCKAKRWRKDELERLVGAEIVRIVLDEESIAAAARRAREEIEKAASGSGQEKGRLLEEIRNLRERRERLLDAVESGVLDSADIRSRMDSVKNREAYVFSELERLSALPSPSEEEMGSMLRSAAEDLRALGAPSAAFFDRYVESVELDGDSVRVKFRLGCCGFFGVGSPTSANPQLFLTIEASRPSSDTSIHASTM